MEKTKILYVNQEMSPYTKDSPLAFSARDLPQFTFDTIKSDIRVIMPKYGAINERKNQLHEVIRLSGMNIVINDVDFPLIIKVASLPVAKMQIYFVDNEDFFATKNLVDRTGKSYEDSDTKLIFFARGIVETTMKLNWIPNIIHIQGWFGALLPLYMRRFYKNNPMCKDAKIILSLNNDTFKGKINKKLLNKLKFDNIPAKDIARYEQSTYTDLMKAAIDLADGVIVADEKVDLTLTAHAKKTKTPLMPYKSEETFFADVNNFYQKILAK